MPVRYGFFSKYSVAIPLVEVLKVTAYHLLMGIGTKGVGIGTKVVGIGIKTCPNAAL